VAALARHVKDQCQLTRGGQIAAVEAQEGVGRGSASLAEGECGGWEPSQEIGLSTRLGHRGPDADVYGPNLGGTPGPECLGPTLTSPARHCDVFLYRGLPNICSALTQRCRHQLHRSAASDRLLGRIAAVPCGDLLSKLFFTRY
jgi:hypothetical protein